MGRQHVDRLHLEVPDAEAFEHGGSTTEERGHNVDREFVE